MIAILVKEILIPTLSNAYNLKISTFSLISQILK